MLLRDGASLCTSAEDVIEALARQNLAREEPRLGFAEAGAVELVEPLWDECELWGAEAETIAPRPRYEFEALVSTPPETHTAVADTAPVRGDSDESPRDPACRIAELLGPVPISVDELIRASKVSVREVKAVLLQLELAGRLERHGGDLVSLVPGPRTG